MQHTRYKYLHLLPSGNSIYSIEFVKFIHANFTPEDHLFVAFSSVPSKDLEGYSNVVYEKEFSLKVSYSYESLSDWIFLHGLSYSAWELIRMKREFAKKIVWCVWGHDLYRFAWGDAVQEKVTVKNIGRWIYARWFRFIWMFADRKVASFKAAVASFEGDRLKLRRQFRSMKLYDATYVTGYFIEDLECVEKERKENIKKRILLGHCAYPFLKHEKYLDRLRKYANEDFQLVIPLSYGPRAYANAIEKKARALFGDKALVLREKMSWLDYVELIGTIDVAIFDYKHQSALGNIYLLLYLRKKIYLSPAGLIYKGLKNINVRVYDCREIGTVPFDQFTGAPSDSAEGREYARKFFDRS